MPELNYLTDEIGSKTMNTSKSPTDINTQQTEEENYTIKIANPNSNSTNKFKHDDCTDYLLPGLNREASKRASDELTKLKYNGLKTF